ncbi:MAG: MFS transporter [Planctomycetota bacterium]
MNLGKASAALAGLLGIDPRELRPVLLAFSYFFLLLFGYFVIRPLREEMGAAGGVKNLPNLWIATFLVTLASVPAYSWLISRVPRRRCLPALYLFFAANLAVFWTLFRFDLGAEKALARTFYVWVSVFNVFAISVFWSFMADVFGERDARRLFAVIAAGGTAGAVAGSAATSILASRVIGDDRALSVDDLLFLPIVSLVVVAGLVLALGRWDDGNARARGETPRGDRAIGGGALGAFREVARSPLLLSIAVLVVFEKTAASFLYFQVLDLVGRSSLDRAARTALFADANFGAQTIALLLEVVVTGRLLRRFGVIAGLAGFVVVNLVGFSALAVFPTLLVAVVFDAVRRGFGYGLDSPSRQVLFTTLTREEKYKAKSLIDTALFRLVDVVSGNLCGRVIAAGVGVAGTALAMVPVGFLWAGAAWRAARLHRDAAGGEVGGNPPAPGAVRVGRDR